MDSLAEAIEAAQPIVYGIVAIATFVRWLRLRDAASAWAAAMFGVLGGVIGSGLIVGDDPGAWAQKITIATLVLFPYLLFRFAATFRDPGPVVEVVAGALTAAAVVIPFLFMDIPGAEDDLPASFAAYTVLVVVEWVGLSALVATWLWRAGRGQPTVVRRRIRTLAVAVGLLAGAILLAASASGSADEEGEGADVIAVITGAMALAAAPLFLAGLAPPAVLLAQWRQPEEDAMRDAEAGLVAATSPDEVATALLPYVARTMGGEAAVLGRADGTVIAAHGVDDARAVELLAQAEDPEPGARPVMSIPMRSGRLAVVADRYGPYFGSDETKVLARLGSLTDVALRRAELTEAERASAQDVQRAHQAMQEFLSIASHDLRTPIAVVKGYAATMATSWEAIPDADKRSYLDTINRQADRLSRLVTDLLTASQLDVGAVEPELEPIDLAELVADVVADLEHDGEVEQSIERPLVVHADEDHATRIVRNLIENAFHYGAPPVTITASRANGSVELRVRDSGEGVDEEFIPRLWDRFARASSASSRTKHGTGLGLSIVRGLARTGGGDAWYEAGGPGACFVVRFVAEN